MLPDKKGLSPVVSAIILIAVTVAVAIAATTWLGSMTLGFMEVDQITITSQTWATDSSYIDLAIQNFGTTSAKIIEVQVNKETASSASYPSGHSTPSPEETTTLRITQTFTPSRQYEFTVITSSGIKLIHVATAPSGPAKIWYDQSWNKRKEITIDNSLNSEDLVDYQLAINVQYDSDMLSDFSDLRFTSNDKQTTIPFWIENYVSSDHATVWIKVPSIAALSTETIYMYYGNPSAVSESNPDNTFDLFVDFTRDGVTSYGGSQDTNPSQWEIIDDTTLRMWGNNWKCVMKTLDVAGDGSQAICFYFKSDGVQAEINGAGLDDNNDISNNWFYRIYGTQSWGLNDHYGYTGGGDWQSYTIVLDNFSHEFDRIALNNDADAGQATNVYYRNVRVCQYSAQEPSTEISAEENK